MEILKVPSHSIKPSLSLCYNFKFFSLACYHTYWPHFRLVFIGSHEQSSIFSILPEELIRKIVASGVPSEKTYQKIRLKGLPSIVKKYSTVESEMYDDSIAFFEDPSLDWMDSNEDMDHSSEEESSGEEDGRQGGGAGMGGGAQSDDEEDSGDDDEEDSDNTNYMDEDDE